MYIGLVFMMRLLGITLLTLLLPGWSRRRIGESHQGTQWQMNVQTRALKVSAGAQERSFQRDSWARPFASAAARGPRPWLRVPLSASGPGKDVLLATGGHTGTASTTLLAAPMMLAKGKGKEASPYSDSVSLPKTPFSQRANAKVREPELQQFWEEARVFESLGEQNPGDIFVLHDGPPYANGDIHIGHALNKILKDFINRYQVLQGRKVRFVPGWDTHGLPIELKMLTSMSNEKRKNLSPLELRKKAASFAKETMEAQREAFKRLGVWADWERPYLTLQPGYEAAQIDVFGKMFLKGYIYRGRKPVHWSPSSRTALAEAELEYPEGHVSRSIYASFQVTEPAECLQAFADQLRVAIWTTTPWTIPANVAVSVNSDLNYSVVGHPSLPQKLIVAQDLISSLASKLDLPEGAQLEEFGTFKGADIAGTKYTHPLYDRTCEIVIGGEYITTESGTGLVHTAPGHGQDDYLTGLKYGLELISPVDDAGKFTAEAGQELRGLSVLGDGNTAVIEKLQEAGAMIREEAYNHKYPYDWRTKKPTIFRATSQWFASVDAFRDASLGAIETVTWTPESGQNRITPMVEQRSDWCISRQRAWGVPIPVFYHRDTGEALINEDTLEQAKQLIAKHGTDIWWSLDEKDLLPSAYADVAHQYVKGTDTMDVWFDSGTSWAGVLDQRDNLQSPADVYLEGSDQHRGWLQSSLLTSVAAKGIAPYKQVITHGFVLDEKGTKMSKSVGNVISPLSVIEGGKNQKTQPGYGADVLRLWVASVNYAADVRIGPSIIKQIFEAYRKLRNTARFLLGSLHDYNPDENAVPDEDLPAIDRYILSVLDDFVAESKTAYEEYTFSTVFQKLQQFAVSDLSNFYLDIAKDRLYIPASDDPRRRSAQTVIDQILRGYTMVCAPILPHLAEDIWQALPYKVGNTSVFEEGWPQTRAMPQVDHEEWVAVRSVRDIVSKVLEDAREKKQIGMALESRVYVHTDDKKLKAVLEKYTTSANRVDELRYFFLVSRVDVLSSADAVRTAGTLSVRTDGTTTVGLSPAEGTKCDRCWHYSTTVGDSKTYDNVCERCDAALSAMSFPPVNFVLEKEAEKEDAP